VLLTFPNGSCSILVVANNTGNVLTFSKMTKMGAASSMYEEEQRCIQGFSGET
jgi:hypothetical protein